MAARLTQGKPNHRLDAVRLLRVLAVAAVLLPLSVLAAGGTIAWYKQQEDAWKRTARLADLVYETVSKLMDTQLLVLEETQQLVRGMDDATIQANEAMLHDRLSVVLHHLPHVRDVFIVGRDGHGLVTASQYPAPYGVSVADRDYVRHFADGGSGVYVSAPGIRRSDGQRYFNLSIRRSLPDGRYGGVIAASVRPEFFEDYFHRMDASGLFTGERTVSIRRSDGVLLARSPPVPASVVTTSTQAARDFIPPFTDSGRFRVRSVIDGQERLVAWRRLPDVGIIVFTSVTQQAVFQQWLAAVRAHLYFGIPATLALVTITLLAMRRTSQAESAARLAEVETHKRLQAEEAIRQSQKLEALGKLTGGVAHDFNNLLAVILGSAELAKRRAPRLIDRQLDSILHAGQRAAALTRQLLSYARNQTVAPRVLDLRVELPRMQEILKPSLRGNITLSLRIPNELWPIEVDPGELEIAVLNVAVNARDAMPAGGGFTIEALNTRVVPGEVAEAPDLSGEFVLLALADTGVGMSREILARAFEPFFTTKEIGRGTGLGLSQVYGFARQAGGAVSVTSEPGHGTCLRIYLPRSHKPLTVEATEPPASAEDGAGQRRILLVEDNREVASISADMLRNLGYAVELAERAQAALDRLTVGHPPLHLLLTDVVMPDGMSGLDLARQVRARMPALPILLASGYSEVLSLRDPDFVVLRKPFTMQQLDEALRQEFSRDAGPKPAVDVMA